MKSTWLLSLLLICFCSISVRADIIIEPIVTVTIGTVNVTIVASKATGSITVDGVTVPMPPGGGFISRFDPLSAGAQARVDLATQKISSGAGIESGSGESASAKVDIQKNVTVVAQTFATVTVHWIAFKDPKERDDFFFAPGVMASLSTELSLTDVFTGTLLYDQTSSVNESGAVAGPLPYLNAPGHSFGRPGIGTLGLPNPFSNNRYVWGPWSVDMSSATYNLAAGETLNLSDDFTLSSSIFVDPLSGPGLVMAGTAVPEPSAFVLLGSGLLALGRLVRRRS